MTIDHCGLIVDHFILGIDLSVHPEVSDDILMGVFDPNGVDEVAQDIVEQLNGIPVGRTGKLAVYIVRCVVTSCCCDQ